MPEPAVLAREMHIFFDPSWNTTEGSKTNEY